LKKRIEGRNKKKAAHDGKEEGATNI
jgi:hypothetical protein